MTTTASPAAMDTDAVRRALRMRYPASRFAVFEEVRNGAGFNANRSCDMMVMSLWPSDGLELHGIEIKASRSDLLRELKQPEKADAMLAVCDRWWLAVGDREIVSTAEVPESWGLLAPRGGQLVVVKQAPKLTPLPLDRGTLASILKRAQAEKGSVVELEKARAEAREEERRHLDYRAKRDREELDELKKAIAEFEQASWLKLAPWEAGGLGRR